MTVTPENPRDVSYYPPINGRIPDVVSDWNAHAQMWWYARFFEQITWNSDTRVRAELHHCESTQHKGRCCSSCHGEAIELDVFVEDLMGGCCCLSNTNSTLSVNRKKEN